ncbi:hypothetical protein OG21DRAFT_1515080 [Imleria badia]|nr:hypothetical protein OG21DRAFT_1515080 [Imleria badia]
MKFPGPSGMTVHCKRTGYDQLGVARMTEMSLALNKNQSTYNFVAAVRDDRYDGRTTKIRPADKGPARTQCSSDQISPDFKIIHHWIYEEIGKDGCV